MTVGPFPVTPVLERLREHVQALLLVGDAADLDTALDQQPAKDCAAYVTSAEIGGRPRYTGDQHIQNVDVTLRVVLMVRNFSGQGSGSGARRQMDEQVIPGVRKALIGWTPVDAFDALSFQAGRDEKYRAGWLVNQQVFVTNYRTQHTPLP